MEKEPRELADARTHLGQFEKSLGDLPGHSDLSKGISLLVDVIEGNYPPVYKERALNLVLTYREKVLSKVKVILSDVDSYDIDSLENWNQVMEVFTDSDFNDHQEFNLCKKQLFHQWGKLLVESLSPWERELLIKELQKKIPHKEDS